MIYLDYNATSPLWPEVAELLAKSYSQFLGNPSSVHGEGRQARARLTQARERVARMFGCEPKEVIFTGSGSEGAALAIKGSFRTQTKKRIVSTPFEHPAVLAALGQLEKEGAQLVYTKEPIAALDQRTALCSVMLVNNETGEVLATRELAAACAQKGILFHTDAVQAVGRWPCTLRDMPADFISVSAHKFGGPVGVGALIARRGLSLDPLVPGHHEDGRRGGTQAVVLAEALSLALELSMKHQEESSQRLLLLTQRFETGLKQSLNNVVINQEHAVRAPGVSNVRFENSDGEAILIALDLEGIRASSGAACASGSLKPSHVLTALGLSSTQTQSSLRFSMGRGTTLEEIDKVVDSLARIVPSCRLSAP